MNKCHKGHSQCLIFSVGVGQHTGLCYPLRGGGEKMMMKKFDGTKSVRGLVSLFVVVGGAVGRKGQYHRFTLRSVISCDSRICMYLLLESGK